MAVFNSKIFNNQIFNTGATVDAHINIGGWWWEHEYANGGTADRGAAEVDARPAWIRHEDKHVEQEQRKGWFTFLTEYIYKHIKYGYKDNPLEVEAREAEKK